MSELLVMRHAKSDWSADYESDHDRPLNERGRRSAKVIGEALQVRQLTPDLVVTSTAVRARTTAELAIDAGRWDCDLQLESRLYGSGPEVAMNVAAATPESERLMLVGHEPTWSMLVRLVTGQSVEMKTATVAVIDVAIDHWGDLGPGTGALLEVIQPRDHL